MISPKKGPATIVPPPLVYPAGLAAGWGIDRYIPLEFHGGDGLRLLALLLVALGLMLIAWALYTIWQHHTTVNPYKAVTHLVSVGPFAFSRNPIYVGDWLIYAGISLLLKTWWTLPFTPVIWWIMRYHVIAHEEAHLEAQFGDAFGEYRARVRRWI
jgi:protein-S-isoprenylcysteine O-methyltransferase Ste14